MRPPLSPPLEAPPLEAPPLEYPPPAEAVPELLPDEDEVLGTGTIPPAVCSAGERISRGRTLV